MEAQTINEQVGTDSQVRFKVLAILSILIRGLVWAVALFLFWPALLALKIDG